MVPPTKRELESAAQSACVRPPAAAEFVRRWRLGQRLEVEAFLAEWGTPSTLELAEVIRTDQRERWRRGEQIPAEQYLQRFPQVAADEELAVDVIYAEFLLREGNGEQPAAAEFQRRFPQLHTVLNDQFALHQAVAHGDEGEPVPTDTLAESSEADQTVISTSGSRRAMPLVANAYEIIEELGRGGAGIVYRARHLGLNRLVALKVLRAGQWVSSEQLQRFRAEAETVARLHHPHIVQIFDYGDQDGLPYLALELVDGGTLAARLNGTPWPGRQAAELVSALSLAIHFAHECGVIHRDLKPANVLLEGRESRVERRGPEEDCARFASESGSQPWTLDSRLFHRPKITDFGLAKTFFDESRTDTENGAILGTPNYMAPEQASGQVERIGPATDVYALGAILYELLTGKPPFKAATALETLNQVLSCDPVSISRLQPRVPKDLATICTKCLSKEPPLRYATARDLAEDLDRFLADRPIQARPTGMTERTRKWCRRNPTLATLGSSVVLLLIAVAAISFLNSVRLSAQLHKTLQAEIAQHQANEGAQLSLWDSYLMEIAARQGSRRVGQRFDALQTVDKANLLLDKIGRTPERVLRLRNAAIASLVLPDLHVVKSWACNFSPGYEVGLSLAADRIAFAAPAGDMSVHRLSNNEPLLRITHQSTTAIPALSADGRFLAVIDKETIKVWQIDGPEPLLVWEHAGAHHFSFSPDSRQAAFGNQQAEMQLLDLPTGTVARRLGRGPARSRFTFHGPSRRIAVCGQNSLQVISWDTGEVLIELPGPDSEVSDVQWHASGRFVAAGGYDERVVLWNIASAQQVMSYPHCGGALRIHFDRDGENLLTFNPWEARTLLWDTGSGQLLLDAPNSRIHGHDISLVGKQSLVRLTDQQIELWEVEPGDECRALSHSQSASLGGPNNTSISPDGQVFAVGRQGGLELWDVSTGEQLVHHAGTSLMVAFDHLGNLLAGCDLGVIRWARHVSTATNLNQELSPRKSLPVHFGPPELLCGPGVWGTLAASTDGLWLAFQRPNGWCVLKSDAAEQAVSLGNLGDCRRAAITSDHRHVAVTGWSIERTRVFDCQTGKQVADLPTSTCGAVYFSPDNRWLATSPGGVQLWRVQDWQLARELHASGGTPNGLGIAFSPDSRVMAIGQPTGITRLIVPETGRDIAELTHPDQSCASLIVFSPDQSRLITLENDRAARARIWDLSAIRRQLAQRGLDWPEDLLRARPVENIDAAEQPVLQVTLDSGHLFDKHQARVLLHDARQVTGAAACKLLDKSLKLDPQNAVAHNELSWLLATGSDEVRDPQRSLHHARQAVALNGDTPTYWNTLGVALYRAGEFADSVSMLNRSLEHAKGDAATYDLIFLALCHARLGDWSLANDCNARAVAAFEASANSLSSREKDELTRFLNEAKAIGLPREN